MEPSKISKGTIIRTIVLFITMANGALAMFGKRLVPIGEDDVTNAVNAVYAAVSAVTLIVAAIAAWWHDNNFTKWARTHQKPKKP